MPKCMTAASQAESAAASLCASLSQQPFPLHRAELAVNGYRTDPPMSRCLASYGQTGTVYMRPELKGDAGTVSRFSQPCPEKRKSCLSVTSFLQIWTGTALSDAARFRNKQPWPGGESAAWRRLPVLQRTATTFGTADRSYTQRVTSGTGSLRSALASSSGEAVAAPTRATTRPAA